MTPEQLFALRVYPRGDCWEWRTIRESCGRTVLRAALRTQVASAVYEVGAALTKPSHWGEPGHGLGLLDHAAVTIGSAALAGGVCFVRGL